MSRVLPDPGFCSVIKLSRSSAGGVFNFEMVSEGLTSKCFAAEQTPTALLQVEPTGGLRNRYLMHTRMVYQPEPNWSAGVTGQVISNQVQLPVGIGLVNSVEQLR
jgi:hypothetical protein